MEMIQSEATAARRRVPLHLVDATDGITPETGEAGGQPQISKNGAAFANTSATLTAVGNGLYYVELTAAELDTLGWIAVRFKSANTAEYQIIITVKAFNTFTATPTVDVEQISGDATAATNLEADYDGTGYAKTNSTIGTATNVTNQVTADVTAVSGDSTAADNLELDYDGTGYNKANSTIGTCTTNTDMRGTDSALLASSAPTNFSDLAITATTGKVTVGTNDDKTGYSILGTKTTLDDLNDISTAQVNTEVDNALDTAIPVSPTADSINQRIKALDELLESGGSGDAAAILTDTNSLNDTKIPDTLSLANINAEADTALSDIGLDHLLSTSVTGTDVADNSVIAKFVSKSITADFDSFDNTTDSLEAIRDNQAAGAADWSSGEKEQIRSALGVDGTKTAATGGQLQTIDTVVDGIQSDLDNGTDGLGAIKADTAAILTDTADMQPKLGIPAGASISADIATIDGNVDTINTNIGTPSDFGSGTSTIAANLEDIADDGTATYDRTTDSLQAIRDRGDANWSSATADAANLQNTTIATLASQTSFTLTAGSADDDAYNGCVIVITDSVTSEQKAIGVVSDYTGASKTITLLNDPGVFTMAVGDTVDILADRALKPSVDNRTLSVEADGDLTKVNTLDGHTPQTGDNFARLGAPAGASVSADIADVKSDTADILVDTGTTLDGKLNTIDTNVDAILVDTGTTIPGILGTPAGASISADIATVDGNVDSILVDTGTTIPGILGTPAGASISADNAAIKSDTAAILTDTADMQPKLGTPVTDISADIAAVKTETADILTDTAEIGVAGAGLTDVGGMSSTMKAQVNAEMVDVLFTDTLTELTARPIAEPSIADALMAQHMELRNKGISDSDNGVKKIHNAAGSVVYEKVFTEVGNVYTEEQVSNP